VLGKP